MNWSAFLLGIVVALFPVAVVWANGVIDRYYGAGRVAEDEGGCGVCEAVAGAGVLRETRRGECSVTVYFVRFEDRGRWKIGYTAGLPDVRLRGSLTFTPCKAWIEGEIRGDERLETVHDLARLKLGYFPEFHHTCSQVFPDPFPVDLGRGETESVCAIAGMARVHLDHCLRRYRAVVPVRVGAMVAASEAHP